MQGDLMSFQHYFRALLEGKSRGTGALLILSVLSVFAMPYAILMRLRALAFRIGVFRTHRLPKPVVSVGNITAGGTGKSPMVAWIARYLIERGKRVAVLSRGYGGSAMKTGGIVSDGRRILMQAAEAGDEPVMLAETVPGLIVAVGADRYRSGLGVLRQLEADVFILDDGFQHQRLYRDLDILLLDAKKPLGNGHVLPAGLMREPRSAASRADLIVYTRCEGVTPVNAFPEIPFCRANHEIVTVRSLKQANAFEPVASLRSLKGVAFAGIADPERFFSMLRHAGLNLASVIAFPDHCVYDNEALERIGEAMDLAEGDYLITTEKDAVKLPEHFLGCQRIYAAILRISIPEEKVIFAVLDKMFAS